MLARANCFEPAHVILELQGKSKAAMIVELAELGQRLGLVRDATWFVGALIQRENVMPSAMGNGLAFLPTLRRSPEQVVKPFLVLGRSREGVDFDALDAKPVHLFFVLGLKYDALHLPWLAQLVHMLTNPRPVRALPEAADAAAIYQRLSDYERKLEPRVAAGA